MPKYKRNAMLICSIGLILLLVGTTYSFFNYTRTGNPNNFSVGRISFVTDQSSTINLSNIFPIDSANVNTDTDNVGTVVVTITGDTDLDKGIEYLVSSQDTNIYTSSGKQVPLSLNITTTGLGTSNSNYYTERENTNESIYKKLVGDELVGDQMILVGYIVPNDPLGTPDGIDGSITIKAYFDKNKILISDTPEESASIAGNRTILSTSEWDSFNSNGVSFKVKVEANEGIWVNGSLEDIMKKNAVMDNTSSTYVSASTGIDFGAFSSDTNGKGVYTRAGTENDAYPIMYYRGDISDNNVLFANQCWKAVRTTNAGGVKLIYNGSTSNYYIREFTDVDTYLLENEKYPFTFNETNKTFDVSIDDSDGATFEFKVPSGSDYSFVLSGTATSQGSVSLTLYKDGVSVNGAGGGGGGSVSLTHNFGTLTSDNVIKMIVTGTATQSSPSTLSVKMQQNSSDLTKGSYSVLSLRDTGALGCDNSGPASQITVNNTNTFTFSSSDNSPTYNGYMYGTVYAYSTSGWTSGARFGSGFTWDGTNYTLVDDETTTPNATHHYSCNVTTANGTCTQIRYVYHMRGSTKYYIVLTGGDGIEEALVKMQTNTNDSNAKDKIDKWYLANMTNYTNKLEDTIWCNDRSMNTQTNGWIADGGSLSNYLYYSSYGRTTQTYTPSLSCSNKNDAFTWKSGNGNQALDYPVGLLTSDEIMLAGGKYNAVNGSYYLTSGNSYWSLSPYSFEHGNAVEFSLGNNGHLDYLLVDNSRGLRPSVSLKPGIPVVSGSGTVANPYVIE